ncbi:MAG TPA: hypothetical protein PL117_02070 [Accumulibacter sp.]|uniref:hypothetical protein n=1 Tax=Accumulibacter sp. TaxID=2053492 RepID=UPI002BD66CBE|nr:hypothetical protein [Accumulibacter sp.]HRF71534.1 hypothetical protein [Accumulibacter sp.]
MTLALPEFVRQLQPLLAGWVVTPLADGWQLQQAGRGVEIRCQPLPMLQMGALALARLQVTVAFSGGSAEQHAAFMNDFQRHFRRGGG